MFVYLNWKNKNGDDLKTLLEETKAKDIADQMEALGIEVRLSPEAPITYIK
jgi:flagellar motility protein MotE (MotC chaperone)